MIQISHSHLYTAALTHPGMGGRPNEDRFAILAFRLSSENPTPSVFAIVSDGIGGHRAGEVAAEMAVEQICQIVAQSDAGNPLAILQQAIQTAGQNIALRAQGDTQMQGMGTTCACAWVIGTQLYIASVGDSRIYLLRQGRLRQLTVDHTWVQEAIEKGFLSPEQAVNHINQHVIRRYLGSSKPPQADIRLKLATEETDTQARANQGMSLWPNDVILLCTDGLTDVVSDEQIETVLRNTKDVQHAAHQLIDLACQRQGRDNITALLLKMPSLSPTRTLPWKNWITIGAAVLLALAFLVLFFAWLVFRVILPPTG
ncbi:MAG: protein phosphatase 2C domain-containing protein [Anaerolineales bacterium]|nr:protein phosphatase 2C domain-containing protein [Anaerolineales bacterium]MCX7608986.1 protein phosphatase 2C domain-containing protein [Anaerolineales bacterium]MDW8227052.1 protein phosphatase 2C domain-containing protein [Anaerolineales bacterium]